MCGNARIAAHKSCPNAPVFSTWRLISPENRSGLRSGNCNSFPLLIRHRRQADKASVWMGALAAPNKCVYLNGCDLLLLKRTDVVGGSKLAILQTDRTNPLVTKSKNQS